MKKIVNRFLAGLIASALIMTGNAFSVPVFASENEPVAETETVEREEPVVAIDTALAEDTAVTEDAIVAKDCTTDEEPGEDAEEEPAQAVEESCNEDETLLAEDETAGDEDAEYPEEAVVEDDDDISDLLMASIAPGDWDFGRDWRVWSQSGFHNPTLKAYGCRMVAYAKMMIATGAVPLSEVENGSFNPGVFYDWCLKNKWFISDNITEKSDENNPTIKAGGCAIHFAEEIYGATLSYDYYNIEKKTDAERKTMIVELAKAGKIIILGSNPHYVFVDTDKTASENYPYVQESFSSGLGRTARIGEEKTKPLSIYTNIRVWECTSAVEPLPQDSYSGKCGPNLTWTMEPNPFYDNKYNLTISGTGEMYSFGDYTYVGDQMIDERAPWIQTAERNNLAFAFLSFKPGITKIGRNAFVHMQFQNSTLYIPDTVRTIEEYAFYDSNISGELTIPDSVVTIGRSAFYGTDITGLKLSKNCREIPQTCFYGCDALTGNIVIPEGVETICGSAFALYIPDGGTGSNQKTRNVTFPNSLKRLEYSVFRNNVKLTVTTEGILPPNLTELGVSTFENCRALTGTLTIPTGVDSIEPECFSGCTGLTWLNLHDGLESIGSCAFYGCTGLHCPLSLRDIYVMDEAFKNCSGLAGIEIKKRIPGQGKVSLGNGAFENCTGLGSTLELCEDDVRFSYYDRVFHGTGYSTIKLIGGWQTYVIQKMKGRYAVGSYSSYVDGKHENADLSTFPDDATIYYDELYAGESYHGYTYGYHGETAAGAVNALGYSCRTIQSTGEAHRFMYAVEANGANYSCTMGSQIWLSPVLPYYADDALNAQFTLADPSIGGITKDYENGRFVFTPKKTGKTRYTVSFTNEHYGTRTASGTFTVLVNPQAVNGVNLDRTSTEIQLWDSCTIKATVSPNKAKNKAVTWSSSDKNVATVSNAGVVKGVGPGTAVITATTKENGFTASCTVKVNAKECKATFVLNGGVCDQYGYWAPAAIIGAAGSFSAPFIATLTDIKSLPVPVREGHVFDGWCADRACTSVMKSIPKTRNSDLTLYAKWTPWKYTVIYDANKNQGNEKMTVTGNMAKTTESYGLGMRLASNAFVNKGYSFAGWTLTPGGTEPMEVLSDEENLVAWNDVLSDPQLCPDKNGDSLKLYAVWEKADYFVEYELNGGQIKAGTEEQYVHSYEFGTADPIVLPVPEREGYRFEGWFADASLKSAVKQIDKKTFGNLTLYAKWSAPYTVVLHNTENGETKELKGFTYNKEKALSANPFKNATKAFIGWKTDPDGDKVVYADKAKLKTPILSNDGNPLKLDLYTVWESDFTIVADFAGGAYVANEKNIIPENYTYETVAKKAITFPTKLDKTGYKFAGWYDAVTGAKVTKITKTTCGNYRVFAKWTPLTYQITYNANFPNGKKGGGKMTAQKLTYGREDESPLQMNAFYVNGYSFAGWSTDPNATYTKFEDGAVFDFGAAGYRSKVTLYAVWKTDL